MPARIRLQRRGKKGGAFYHIVIADGRAPRDGKFIEKIGTYNPLTKPAEIDLDFDKTLDWLTKGAQPSDTVRAILSYKGVIYKNHLLKGVKKGALTQEQAEAKFQAWLTEKEAKVNKYKLDINLAAKEESKKRIEAEAKINEAKAAEIAKRNQKELEAKAAKAQAKVAEEEQSAETVEVRDPIPEPKSEADTETETENPEQEAKQ